MFHKQRGKGDEDCHEENNFFTQFVQSLPATCQIDDPGKGNRASSATCSPQGENQSCIEMIGDAQRGFDQVRASEKPQEK